MKITKKMIKNEKDNFDGTCPFSDKSTECSKMSYKNCNDCKVSKQFRKGLLNEVIDDMLFEYLPHWLYRLPFRIKDLYYDVVSLMQTIFRKNHTSDKELWSLSYYIVKFIYPKILAFKNMERTSYPYEFFDSKEEGEKEWEEILDKILFACEYQLQDWDEKKYKNFYKKWDIVSPYSKDKKDESFSLCDTNLFYSHDIEVNLIKRAQEGFELLGKHLMDLLD